MAWDLWLSLFPHMHLGLLKFEPFGEFMRKLYKPVVETTDMAADEIETEMLQVIAAYEGR